MEKMAILQWSTGLLLGAFLPVFFTAATGCVWLVLCIFLKRKFGSWLAFGVGMLVMGIRLFFIPDLPREGDISEYNGEHVVVEASVTADSVVKAEKISAVLSVLEVCDASGELCHEADGLIQTWLSRYPRVGEGQVLVIQGMLDEPEDFENEDKFSYASYLADKHIFSIMYRPELIEMRGTDLFLPYQLLVRFREAMVSKINSNLPEPHASLLAGILLGVRRTMPEDFSADLRRTGTTHVIAASGYNVTLISQAIMMVLGSIHRRLRLLFAVGGVWLFVLLSGASLPVMRAGIMISFALVASLLGRASLVHVVLPLSGGVMALFDPAVISDISFQLSFVSTAGLIYGVPVLQGFFPWIPASLEDSTLVTAAAILFTFPITAFNFGEFSVVALLVNFLVLPVISLVMALGGVMLVAPGVLGQFFAILCWVPLEYFVRVVRFFSSIPFAVLSLPDIPGWFALLLYALLLVLVLLKYKGIHQKHLLGGEHST